MNYKKRREVQFLYLLQEHESFRHREDSRERYRQRSIAHHIHSKGQDKGQNKGHGKGHDKGHKKSRHGDDAASGSHPDSEHMSKILGFTTFREPKKS